MLNKTVAKIQLELALIDELFATYAELLTRVQTNVPDIVEITALASVLHSFYNGLEHIFEVIAKEIDKQLPTGERWHRDLLIQMSKDAAQRSRVLTDQQAQVLANYLGFRHFYRHSYSHFLDWDDLEKLVTPLSPTWNDLKPELEQFINTLSSK